MARLVTLADFQRIQFISAKVASAKVNKTKVPAVLCSLDVGHPLLEVQLHHRQNSGRSTCSAGNGRHSNGFPDIAAYAVYRFGRLLRLLLSL